VDSAARRVRHPELGEGSRENGAAAAMGQRAQLTPPGADPELRAGITRLTRSAGNAACCISSDYYPALSRPRNVTVTTSRHHAVP